MSLDLTFARIAGVRPHAVRIDDGTLTFEGISPDGYRFMVSGKIGPDIDKATEGLAALCQKMNAGMSAALEIISLQAL